MQKTDKRIVLSLIYGGRGMESSVSLRGMENISSLIDRDTYSLLPIYITNDGRWMNGEFQLFPSSGGFFCPENKIFYPTDAAFPLLHGDFGEDGIVQGALENAKIPYIGCDVSAGAVCRDKAFVKIIAKSLDIPTLDFLLLMRDEGLEYAVRRCESEIGYPIFIKPARLGSSMGARSALNRSQLSEALSRAFELSSRAIAEPYLEHKRELECGYFSTKSKEIFTNPGEILIDGLYGYDEKYSENCAAVALRADVSESITLDIREYSRRLVRVLGVRDLARIDFFLSEGRLYFNEINTMPGFTPGSLYPKMLEGVGIGLKDLIYRLTLNAIERD